MPDQSQLDQLYFVDANVYNCPFCNRRHVSYEIFHFVDFDWTEVKRCYAFFVRCNSCKKESMHLSFQEIGTHVISKIPCVLWHFGTPERNYAEGELDQAFFYSVPTSFFSLDKRVPKVLRELLTEAEGCLKTNFLTGASACVRKIVYELSKLEEASGDNYEDRIKSLKKIRPEVEATFFDMLLTIQQLTSSKVHENAYDGWEGKHLRIILASLSEVLHELYVIPALRKDRRTSILALKEELGPRDDNSNHPK